MNPLRFLELEWRKYLPSGAFRVIAALYAGSFILILFLAHQICHHTMVNGAARLAGLFTYPHNWELLAYLGSWLNMFLLGFLGALTITIEFSNRTLRQSVIFGMTRLEAAVSKLVWALAGYLMLGNLAGLLIRKTPLAEMAYLAYVLILETLGRWIFYYTVTKTDLLLYLPNQVLGALTPFPYAEKISQVVQSTVQSAAAKDSLSLSEAGFAALAYLCLFAALFCWRILKSDL